MNDDWYFDCLLTYFSLFWSISLFYVYVCVCKFWYIKNINAWCVRVFTITYDMQYDTMWWRGNIKKIYDTSYILWVDICTNNQNLQKLPKHPWLSQDFSFLFSSFYDDIAIPMGVLIQYFMLTSLYAACWPKCVPKVVLSFLGSFL